MKTGHFASGAAVGQKRTFAIATSTLRKQLGCAAIVIAVLTPLCVAAADTAVATDASRIWVSRFSKAGEATIPAGVATDGVLTYVTGSIGSTSADFLTVAYRSDTGAMVWKRRYDAGGAYDAATAIATDGARVYVTGPSQKGRYYDYVTIAYNASDGAKVWLARYDGPARSGDAPEAIAVAGSRVIVTGGSIGVGTSDDYATIAYDAATGARDWVRRYVGPAGLDVAYGLSTASGIVYVTGWEDEIGGTDGWATIAYRLNDGSTKWVARYAPAGHTLGTPVIDTDGARVYVTGAISRTTEDWATRAYDAATGTARWTKLFNGPTKGDDYPAAVVTDGSRVYVSGVTWGKRPRTNYWDYLTIAYDAASGAKLWTARLDAADDSDLAFAMTLAGGRVYVTGKSYVGQPAGLTVAYDAATGVEAWRDFYTSSYTTLTHAATDGTRVYVTGSSYSASSVEFLTIAYSP